MKQINKPSFRLIIFFLALPFSIFSQAVNTTDSLALVDLYYSTNGSVWGAQDWLVGPVMDWGGISLTPDGTRVEKVYLFNNGLKGIIPTSLGNLTKCKYLNLEGNTNISGQIPNSLGNMTSVESLFLGGNQLTGTIPVSLGNLPNLTWLDLSDNLLYGKIPSNFGANPQLDILNIRYNKFTFDGLENLVQKNIPNLSYEPQDTILKIGRRNDTLFVSAGGIVNNNTYKWYNSAGANATITGDSTFIPQNEGSYSVSITNSIASRLTLYTNTVYVTTIVAFDPNPGLIASNGTINTFIGNLDYNKIVTKVATDGVTKVLLAASSGVPVTFVLQGDKLGSLSTLSNQQSSAKQVTVSPDNAGRVIAIYTSPDGYGKANASYKEEYVTVSDNTGIIGTGHIQLVKPPVVLVHGMWSDPGIWEKGGFVKALVNTRFTNIFLADYKSYNASTFNPNSPESVHGRNAVSSSVAQALSYSRLQKTAVTQVDIVGHSLGGLMSRSWSQLPGFKTTDNFQKGYIHKLITLSTPHRGTPLGPELVASQYNLIRLSTNYTTPIPLWLLLTLTRMPIGSCHADFGLASPGITALQATPPYHAYSIVGDQSGQLLGYAAFTAFAFGALNHSYSEIFRATNPCTNTLSHDLVVPVSSQKGYINASQTFYATGHSLPAFTTVTNSTDVQNKVIDLLLSDNPSEFSAGFPAPSAFPLNCTTANQRIEDDLSNPVALSPTAKILSNNRAVKIISPTTGTVYNQKSNATIKLQFQKLNGAQVRNCVFMVQGVDWFTITDSINNSTTITLPDNTPTGSLNIFLLSKDSSGIVLGDSIHVSVLPLGTLDSLSINPLSVSLDSSIRQMAVNVRGFYKNPQGVITNNDITSSSTGTTYRAKTGGIFSVSTEGLIRGLSGGNDTLIVSNSGEIIKVAVSVDYRISIAHLYGNSINFPPLPDKVTTDQPFPLEASTSSGESVLYALVSGPATLSNGVIALKNVKGTVVVRSSSSRTAYFDSAVAVTRTFRVLDSLVYTFTGSGNWSDSGNWNNRLVPPYNLAFGTKIFLNPTGSECLLDTPIVLPLGVQLFVQKNKRFRINNAFNLVGKITLL